MTMMKTLFYASVLAISGVVAMADVIEMGPRPYYLIDRMQAGPLKDALTSCMGQDVARTNFSISHRGAPMQFPEHTAEGYAAAARMGAGIVECDVTFTKDKELVCRHAQNDLHTTTNILASPLADTCVTPFSPADGDTAATAECRTSEITLTEYRTLNSKMDAANSKATTLEAYLDGTAGWRTDLYSAEPGTLMTHAESIELFKSLGVKFTPELKSPSVTMPFQGLSQHDYAQKLIDEYKAAGIPASDVWAQSFNVEDVLYWVENEPEFGAQAVYLIDHYTLDGWSPMDPATWPQPLAAYKAMGVNYVAPPIWVLLTIENGEIVPSEWAKQAQAAGLNIITWTLERSGPLINGGGWYYQSVAEVINSDGDMFELVDVLAQDVGVAGIFSDWPATVSYYASCMGLE